MNPLDNLERLAQRFVEGTFHRFFGKKLHPADLAGELIASIEAERNGRDKNLLPAHYQITLHPADYMALVQPNGSERIRSELITYLTTFANEANFQFDGPLRIALNRNELVQPGQVEISPVIEIVDRGHP